MTPIIKTSIALLCVAMPTIYACSQVPPPPPIGTPPPDGPIGQRPPPPQDRGPAKRPEGPAAAHIQQLVSIQGSIQAFTASDSTQYDGFTLKGNDQSVDIRFAPHMAAQLMSAAKAGSTISLHGYYETTPEGENVIHLVNATADGQLIYDSPPAPPVNPVPISIQRFDGTITGFRRDRNGTPSGILLSGKRVLDIPPGVYDQMQIFLKPGATISGSGSSVLPPPGVVFTENIRKIHPQTITVNGQTYMVR